LANEVWYNYTTGSTLYFGTFTAAGNVYLSNGESSETWGTGGRTADAYDMAMAENGVGGHYVGSFDISITTPGTYPIVIYLQAGANPADTDLVLAVGEVYWNGESESDIYTITVTNQTVTNVYDESSPPPISVINIADV